MLLIAMDNHRLVFANRRARDRLGIAAEPKFKAATIFVEPGDLARLLESSAANGKAELPHAAFFGADGSRLWFRVEAERVDIGECQYAMIALGEAPASATEIDLDGTRAPWRAIFDKAGVGIVLLDAECRFLEANPRWIEMFGFNPEDMRLLRRGTITPNKDLDRSDNRIGALLRGEIDQYRAEKSYVSKDGLPFWGDLSVGVLRDGQDTPAFVIGFLLDITSRKRAEEQLHETNEQLEMQLLENQKLQEKLSDMAVRDPLTGLFNRRYMEETLRRELSRAARDDGPLSLVIMDIDHFKHLNDTHGHQAGDHVLKTLASLLLSQMRSEDVACRYGGEEFVAILPGAPLAAAAQRAESWRSALEALAMEYEGALLKCTLSVGVSEFPRHGISGDELLSHADSGLYMAKRAGRNRVMIWG